MDSSTSAWDDYLEQLIEAFRPFLLDTLRVSHLLSLLHIQEVKEIAFLVHEKEEKGLYEEACTLLLNAIRQSQQPGKWQMFIDALRELKKTGETTLVLDTLLGERELGGNSNWLKEATQRRLIQLFQQPLEQHMQLEALLGALYSRGLILAEDVGKLRQTWRAGRQREAIGCLMLLLHRHRADWYNQFLTVLWEGDHAELVHIIDPDFCSLEEEQRASHPSPEQLSSHPHSAQQRSSQPSPQQKSSRTSPEQLSGHFQSPEWKSGHPHSVEQRSSPHHPHSLEPHPTSTDTQTAGPMPSLGLNLQDRSANQEKDIGAKSLPAPVSGKDVGAKSPPPSTAVYEKDVGAKSPPPSTAVYEKDVGAHPTSVSVTALSGAGEADSSCGCRCCGRVLQEVKQLKAEMAQVKLLLWRVLAK